MNVFEIVAKEYQYVNKSGENTSPSFFYIIDIKGGKPVPVFFDDNIVNILGYTSEEIMSVNMEKAPFIDKTYREDISNYYFTAINRPGHFEFLTVLIHKGGYPIYIKNRGVTIFKDNQVHKLIGYVESISSIDLKNLQSNTTDRIIKAAYQTGEVGTFYYDLKNNSLHWSDETKKIHGFEEEPTIEEFAQLVQAKEPFSTAAVVKKVVESNQGYQTIYSFKRKSDKMKIYVLAFIFPIIDNKKKLIAVSGNVINLFNKTDRETLWSSSSHVNRTYQEDDSVFIKQHNQYINIPVKDIVAISSMRDYIQIYTKNRVAPYIHYTTLYKFKDSLPEKLFFQIHRSHVINLSLINKVTVNQLEVNGLNFPVSRNYKPKLLKRLPKK